MSRVYFHSPGMESEVRGAERAHMGVLISDFFCKVCNVIIATQRILSDTWEIDV